MSKATRFAMAVAASGLLAAVHPAIAADMAAGKEKAGICATCHGLDGIASAPDAPNIAGDSAIYLTAQLRAYRDGQRQHPQMSIIAQGLSDEDIADLAAWYSAIEVTAKMPEIP